MVRAYYGELADVIALFLKILSTGVMLHIYDYRQPNDYQLIAPPLPFSVFALYSCHFPV